jgi:hypothetical protein
MPKNRLPMMAAMTMRVFLALAASGRRNADTPLEIASTPVSAVVPEAKARRITNIVTAPSAAPWSWSWAACSGV